MSLAWNTSVGQHVVFVRPMQFWMYILRCSDLSYYVGHTDDLARRLAMHDDGSIGGYTSSRRPVTLMYAEVADSRDEVFKRERQVKGWGRAKKEALIAGDWERLHLLAKTAHPSTSSG